MKIYSLILLFSLLLVYAASGFAEINVPIDLLSTTGTSQSVGTVVISESSFGLVFTPNLKGLSPGLHGFHVHQNPSCAGLEKGGKMIPGLAAGGHYDPQDVGYHGTPWGDGHLGDLPGLFVDQAGQANTPVLAARLSLKDVEGRALMIHAGGDNYSDVPAKLGGGGTRVACGEI